MKIPYFPPIVEVMKLELEEVIAVSRVITPSTIEVNNWTPGASQDDTVGDGDILIF
jgi:hypothetical protein